MPESMNEEKSTVIVKPVERQPNADILRGD